MSDELQLPPLSAEAAALLATEQLRPGAPTAIRARILERVAATVGPYSPPSSPASPDPAPAAGTAAAAGSGAGLLIKAGLIVAFVVGVGAGVGGTVAVQSGRSAVPAARSQQVSAPVKPTPASPPVPVAPRVAAREATTVAPPSTRASASGDGTHKRARPVAASVETPAPSESLAAERRLVEMARTALGRTRPKDALAALAQHRNRFPHGQLAEERDALTVLALIASSEGDQARDRAQEFRDRYPRSLLLPAIQAALDKDKRRSSE